MTLEPGSLITPTESPEHTHCNWRESSQEEHFELGRHSPQRPQQAAVYDSEVLVSVLREDKLPKVAWS